MQRNWQSVPKEEKFSSESEHLGLISACTRQPLDHPGPRLRRRAYPRSHGATAHEKYVALLDGGLSPLARGNRACAHGVQAHQGPIPARTGQPPAPAWPRITPWAYPRSHGATGQQVGPCVAVVGLSPLARGNQHQRNPERGIRGPIPARTGQPANLGFAANAPRAYPRSHGATRPSQLTITSAGGLSPLARGNRWVSKSKLPAMGPIPARTGQPWWFWLVCWVWGAYPRSHGATLRAKRQTA